MFVLLGVALAVFLSYRCYQYFLYPLFFSPLSKIPSAHFTASWSPLWMLWVRYNSRENRAVHNAHLKYGPIVRLGPNEISVNCVDGGIRTVYSGGFEKPDFYPNQFQNFGLPNMFSMKDSKPHSVRKRMISNVYSKSYIQSSQDTRKITQSILFERLLPILHNMSGQRAPVQVYELNYAVTMDFITSYLFGVSNDSNFIQDVLMRKEFLGWFLNRNEHIFWDQELPWLKHFVELLGIHLVPEWINKANSEIEAWTLKLCQSGQRSLSLLAQSAGNAGETHPVVFKQLSDSMASLHAKAAEQVEHRSAGPVNLLIASEMLDHLAAGMDTSGITLTYLFWELSQHRDLQSLLRQELFTLSPPLTFPLATSTPSLPNPRDLDALPFLHAIIIETLRIHCPIPGSQPRVTPSTPTSVAGSPPLPGGVRISAQAYSLHRNPDVFPEPEKWKPKRWIDSTKEQRDEMGRWFWAFGSGGRMCIGSNFAMQELKYVTAAVYTNFGTSIVDDTGIEQVDAYTAGPKSQQLTLMFERVKE